MTETLATLRRYVACQADPEGGADLLDLYAADALVLHAGEAVARAGVDRAAFADAHREAARTLRAQGKGFPAGVVETHATWVPAGEDHGVATLVLADPAREGAIMWVVGGVRREGEAYRLAWVGLEPEAVTRTYAEGHASALGEFTFLESQQALPKRDWLDVAYRRQFQYATPPLDLMPGQHFSCHGTASCCKVYWEISAPPIAQALVDAMPWAEIGAPHLVGYQLPPKGDGNVVVKEAGSPCPFLDEHSRCRIHATIGTPVFGACVAFPFRFAETPDGVTVTTSYHCRSARHNLGPSLEDRKEEIWRRLNQVGLMTSPVGGFRFDREAEISWEIFKLIEGKLMAALADPGLSLQRRLWVAVRSLEAIDARQEPTPEAYATEAIPPLQDFELAIAETYAPFFLGCLAKLSPEFTALAGGRPGATEPQDPEGVARWLRTVLHGKECSFKFDLVTAMNVCVVLYAAVLTLETHHGGPIPETASARLGAVTGHNIVLRTLNEIFQAADFMRDELAKPVCGVLFMRWVAHHAAGGAR